MLNTINDNFRFVFISENGFGVISKVLNAKINKNAEYSKIIRSFCQFFGIFLVYIQKKSYFCG